MDGRVPPFNRIPVSICLIDTSILCEFLQIPNLCESFEGVDAQMQLKVEARESLLLPMSTILETGNHIGQNGDGHQRRDAANRFIDLVRDAIDGRTPFTPTPFFEPEALRNWLGEFPDWAMRTNSKGKGSGLGDLTIVKEWERQCALNRSRRVYIWSTDEHLSTYDRQP
jgi:hypothetical protein